MTYLLETSFVIDAILRTKTPFRRAYPHLASHHLTLSIISLAELFEGTFHSTNPRSSRQQLHGEISQLSILPLDEAICARFGELRAQLRRNGEEVADFDLLIGATAVELNLTLVTHDVGDFSRIPELRVARI